MLAGMPALPSVPQVVRAQFNFTVGTDVLARCRAFYHYSGAAPTSLLLGGSANGMMGAWSAAGGPTLQTPQTALDSVTITDLTSPTAAEGTSTSSAIPGTRSGGELPASASMVLSGTVLRRYRGGHPRSYFPCGVDTDLSTQQTWTSGFVALAYNNLVSFLTDYSAWEWSGSGTLTPVNVSFYEGFTTHTGTTGRVRNVSTPRTAPLVDTIVGWVARQGIGQQRKRLLRLA